MGAVARVKFWTRLEPQQEKMLEGELTKLSLMRVCQKESLSGRARNWKVYFLLKIFERFPGVVRWSKKRMCGPQRMRFNWIKSPLQVESLWRHLHSASERQCRWGAEGIGRKVLLPTLQCQAGSHLSFKKKKKAENASPTSGVWACKS